jgi:predicted TIM-barrel fold metal-dependent hydrolase
VKTLLDHGLDGRPLPVAGIIDMHGHLGRFRFAIPDLSPATLVAVMDRIGIQSILCSHMRCMSADTKFGNREVLDAMRAFPGRILGYVSVWPSGPEAVKAETEKWLGEGFTGIKLHCATGMRYSDPAYAPAYAIANERRLPILFHTWGNDDVFAEIRDISSKYPNASLLLAHSGSNNEDGYTRMARECGNVHLELAFSRSYRGLVDRLVAGAGADKVVWGSDAYFFSPTQQIGKVLGARIPDGEKKMILADNAARILGRIQR